MFLESRLVFKKKKKKEDTSFFLSNEDLVQPYTQHVFTRFKT